MSSTSPTDTRLKFERLKSLMKADPGNDALRRDCISLAAHLNDFDYILQASEQVLKQAPRDASARFDKATALIGKKDYSAAIDLLRELRTEFPGQPAAARNLGLCHYCLQDYASARPELELAYQAGDRSADLIRLLVSTLHHLGAVDEAVKIADEHSSLGEGNSGLAGVYALLYLDAELGEQAAKWAAEALAYDSDSVDGLVVRGTLAAEQMNTDVAIRCFDRAAELAPHSGRAWLGLGTMALLARNFEAAKAQFVTALKYMPQHVGSWHVLAWTHIVCGDIDRADAAFRQALELDRNFAETHGGLAATAALRGDATAARACIEVARKLDPKCLSAQFAESVLLGRSGSADQARQTLMSAAAGLADTQNSALGRLLKRAIRSQH